MSQSVASACQRLVESRSATFWAPGGAATPEGRDGRWCWITVVIWKDELSPPEFGQGKMYKVGPSVYSSVRVNLHWSTVVHLRYIMTYLQHSIANGIYILRTGGPTCSLVNNSESSDRSRGDRMDVKPEISWNIHGAVWCLKGQDHIGWIYCLLGQMN